MREFIVKGKKSETSGDTCLSVEPTNGQKVPVAALSQTGQACYLISAFGIHEFQSDDKDEIANELIRLAAFIRRNVVL